MRYFIATEVGVVNLLARHFDWTSNTLWFEDIPNARDPTKAFFLLGGQDSIIHSEVRFYGIDIIFLLSDYQRSALNAISLPTE